MHKTQNSKPTSFTLTALKLSKVLSDNLYVQFLEIESSTSSSLDAPTKRQEPGSIQEVSTIMEMWLILQKLSKLSTLASIFLVIFRLEAGTKNNMKRANFFCSGRSQRHPERTCDLAEFVTHEKGFSSTLWKNKANLQ